ncbi:MAG: hypothetical protein PHO48_03945 [Candidatus Gracilibacteria bacterium]|nr:hypothetical protein [Candidatus Gracilibacteria bacterium]MDD5179564.1 hypothetical protein [Candidatus Gracilibacteria bacterium]
MTNDTTKTSWIQKMKENKLISIIGGLIALGLIAFIITIIVKANSNPEVPKADTITQEQLNAAIAAAKPDPRIKKLEEDFAAKKRADEETFNNHAEAINAAVADAANATSQVAELANKVKKLATKASVTDLKKDVDEEFKKAYTKIGDVDKKADNATKAAAEANTTANEAKILAQEAQASTNQLREKLNNGGFVADGFWGNIPVKPK